MVDKINYFVEGAGLRRTDKEQEGKVEVKEQKDAQKIISNIL